MRWPGLTSYETDPMAVSFPRRVDPARAAHFGVAGPKRRDLIRTCARRCPLTVVSVHFWTGRPLEEDGMTAGVEVIVVGGVDCHSEVHHAAALDDTGRRLGDQAAACLRSVNFWTLPVTVMGKASRNCNLACRSCAQWQEWRHCAAGTSLS